MKEHNFEIYRGDDYAFKVNITNGLPSRMNIEDAQFLMQARPKADGKVLFTLSNDDGITPNNGEKSVTIRINGNKTARFKEPRCYYDLQMVAEGTTVTILRGAITITKDISRGAE